MSGDVPCPSSYRRNTCSRRCDFIIPVSNLSLIDSLDPCILAGTSYGISLLWILAAVTANQSVTSSSSLPSLVIGTENEPKKAAHALNHIREAFSGSIPTQLSLLEGDLLQTLPAAKIADKSIDALLLDIWAPVALPTLKIIIPKLRTGAVLFIDNTVSSTERYKELLAFVRDPLNGFQSTTLPHSGGFDMCVFTG